MAAAGDLLFASGQVGFDPATGLVVDGGIEAQTTRVLANIEAVLAAASLTFADVVKTTVFLKDMKDFAAMTRAYWRPAADISLASTPRKTGSTKSPMRQQPSPSARKAEACWTQRRALMRSGRKRRT